MKRAIAALWLVLALVAPGVAHAVTVKNLDMGKNVQVWYVEDHTLPMISMTAALPAGSAYDPKDKAGLAAFTADLLNVSWPHQRFFKSRSNADNVSGLT